MFNIGGGEMIMLAVLALLVFGPQGLPEIAAKVAKTMKAVRRTADEFQREIQTALQEENRAQDEEKRRRQRRTEESESGANEPTEERKLDAAEETVATMLSEGDSSAATGDEGALPEGTHQVIDPMTNGASPPVPEEDEVGPEADVPAASSSPPAATLTKDVQDLETVSCEAEPIQPEFDDDGPRVPMRPARPSVAPERAPASEDQPDLAAGDDTPSPESLAEENASKDKGSAAAEVS